MKRRPRFFVSILAAMLTFVPSQLILAGDTTTSGTVVRMLHIVKKATKFKKSNNQQNN